MMADPRIDIETEERHGAILSRVTIRNVRRSNCLNTALIVALAEAFRSLGKIPNLRAAILTSEGQKSFIGGADLNELGALCADSSRLFITRLHQACEAIRNCHVPVLARIQGHCLGAGFEIAASCDLRAASDTASFGMPEVQVGLPSVIEAALLPGLIGWGRTREMLLTGRTFSAAEAAQIGLIEKTVAAAELDAAIDGWLKDILRATPEAVRAQKRLINRWQSVSLEEGIFAGIDALSDAYKTGEPQAAIASFFARRRTKS